MRGSDRAPYGDSSRISSARLNSIFAWTRCPSSSSCCPVAKRCWEASMRARTGSAGVGSAGGSGGAASTVRGGGVTCGAACWRAAEPQPRLIDAARTGATSKGSQECFTIGRSAKGSAPPAGRSRCPSGGCSRDHERITWLRKGSVPDAPGTACRGRPPGGAPGRASRPVGGWRATLDFCCDSRGWVRLRRELTTPARKRST